MRQIKVYVTSKRRHASLLLSRLRGAEGVHVVSRWMVAAALSDEDRPAAHWMQENFDDIVSSHAIVVYAELGDVLRLSIGEVYYALAHEKPVFAVGQWVENAGDSGAPGTVYHPAYADWTSYPLVRRVGSLEQAVREIKELITRSDRLDTLGQSLLRLEASVHDLREEVRSVKFTQITGQP